MMLMTRLSIVFFLSALVTACGGGAWGGGGGSDDDDPATAPSAPVTLTANAGDKAVSLGWGVPTTNATGTLTYEVTITPNTAGSKSTIEGTTAIVRGLTNGTTYTLAVTARNSSGTSPAASVQSKPAATLANSYTELDIVNNPTPTGVGDPAPLRTSGGQIWLAYTGIAANGSGQITRSIIRLAQSEDNGESYEYDQQVVDSTNVAAGSPSGFWHYRTPWLIEDSTDPDATRRFKLFAHKYFFNPNNNTFDYQRGAIAMWTAATPDGTWSSEKTVLGWTGGSTAPVVVNQLNIAALQTCQWIDHGSAAISSEGIDFAFNCEIDTLTSTRKIILLRSADHAATFSYISTLLEAVDAFEYEGESFGMPALLPGAGNAPLLIASPIDIDNNALGCVLFPIADVKTGKLFIENTAPLTLQTLPRLGDSSGACGWDRSISRSGILMGNRAGSDYTIQATGKAL